jgi:hypothetical protein
MKQLILISLAFILILLIQSTIQDRRSIKQDDDQLHYFYFPSYGNLTATGSMMRFYGLVYEKRDSDTLSDIISGLIIGLGDIRDLRDLANTDEERENLERNLEPFLRWSFQSDETITFRIETLNRSVTTQDDTGSDGRFDEFINVNDDAIRGDSILYYTATNPVDSDSGTGNITISNSTFGIVSDVDDVLRITEIWVRSTALRRTFIDPYEVVPGMPRLLDILATNLTNPSFHYATTAVQLNGPPYSEFIFSNYPAGSLDMRPLDITDPDDILNARKDQVIRLRETFPSKRFIYLSDMSNTNAIEAFSELERTHPSSVACIFLRNITATYPDFSTDVNLEEEFAGVERRKWFVFDRPEDLYQINFAAGSCRPPGIPDNQTTISGGYGGTSTEARSESSDATSTIYTMCLYSIILPFVALYAAIVL